MDHAKSDTTQLFWAYAAIDQHVWLHEHMDLADVEGEHEAALLLPMYKQPGRHWFPQYLKSAEEPIEQRYLQAAEAREVLKPLKGLKPLEGVKPIEGLQQLDGLEQLGGLDVDPTQIPFAVAKVALSEFAKTDPRCRMHARRLHAVGALARTFKQLQPEELARAALGPRQFNALEDPKKQAVELAALFRRTPEVADSDAALDIYWDGLFFSTALPRQEVVGPRPCTGELRMITRNGDSDPVPTLTTVFDAEIPFDQAVRFCDPLTWTCFPSWCSMKKSKNGAWADQNGGKADWTDEKGAPKIRKYREQVSFDCLGNTLPKLTVDLDFTTREAQDPQRVVITEYRLSEPPNQEDLDVNEGWLEVRELSQDPPMVRVTTTKSVRFREGYGGPWLALISCHVGYMTMVEDLVCCAAKGPLKEGEQPEYPDIGFPGRKPSQPAAQHAMRSAEPEYGGLITAMLDEAADAVQECIDEFSEAAKASYEKIEAKSYKADDLVQDITDYWVRMLEKGAHLAQANRQALETASRGEDRPAPPAAPGVRAQQ